MEMRSPYFFRLSACLRSRYVPLCPGIECGRAAGLTHGGPHLKKEGLSLYTHCSVYRPACMTRTVPDTSGRKQGLL